MLKFKKCRNFENVEIRNRTEKRKTKEKKKTKTKTKKETEKRKRKQNSALPGPAQPTRGVVGTWRSADLVGI